MTDEAARSEFAFLEETLYMAKGYKAKVTQAHGCFNSVQIDCVVEFTSKRRRNSGYRSRHGQTL
ncbi:MAG TPA: hypothetical protein VI756_22520, partial [Blastocatellia bacterium]